MDWANERYVRVYTRDTVDWSLLSWQARALWLMLLRKVDRAGVIQLGRHGVRGIAVLVGMPFEVTEQALAELVKDGCLELRGEWLVAPNFIEAQEADQTDAQRAREYRARRRDRAMLDKLPEPRQLSIEDVTGRDETVTGVGGVRHSDPSLADPAVPDQPCLEGSASPPSHPPVSQKGKRKKPGREIPEDWTPEATHEALARQKGVDLDDEAARFRDHARAHGRMCVNWSAAFSNWLRGADRFAAPKNGKNGHAPAPLPPEMQDWGRTTGPWPGGSR